jgi:hypothetical protein
MARPRVCGCILPLVWMVSILTAVGADTIPVTQLDWGTRTASCPAKVTKSTNLIIRATNINDLLIDFQTGETAQYQLRARGTPVAPVLSENPFSLQLAVQGCPDTATLLAHVNAVRAITDPKITPPKPGGPYVSLWETISAAHSHGEVVQLESDYANTSCADFFRSHSTDAVVQWIKLLDAPLSTSSTAAPAHSADFNVNLEPNENYQFTVQESWKGQTVKGGTLVWSCGEMDVLTLSTGPLVTTLPYRTYNQQQVPNATGTGTQNQLVVSGNTNVNVLGAALVSYHFPISQLPPWFGLAISVGPVYSLASSPSVSKLGLFAGGSIHMYKSMFLTAGVHIGQFADYPAGFHQGSIIPPGFGSLTPTTRNTAHFAIGITFKTVSFKKSTQTGGAATNTGGPPTTGNKNQVPAQQPVSGSQGAASPAQPPNPNPTPQQPTQHP